MTDTVLSPRNTVMNKTESSSPNDISTGRWEKEVKEERKTKTEIDTGFPYQDLKPQPRLNHSMSENLTLTYLLTVPPELH